MCHWCWRTVHRRNAEECARSRDHPSSDRQRYCKDRTVYYSTFPITQQTQKGEAWQFHLDSVYCIGIVDFSFSENGDYFSSIKLQNEETNEVFFHKLTYVFLELPKFNLSLSELGTPREKWLYFLKHLAELEAIPSVFTEPYLIQACEIALYAGLSPLERYAYEQSLKSARDSYASHKTAEEEGLARGLVLGREEGERQAKQEAILTLLLSRFDSVPESVINRITSIQRLVHLNSLFESALIAQTLEEIFTENNQ